MSQKELENKTFDQQLTLLGSKIGEHDISPNKLIPGEIVLEPTATGVRVTGRDSNHHVLWGFIASKEMIEQRHSSIAVYQRLRDLIYEELKKRVLPIPESGDVIQEAEKALFDLDKEIRSLRSLIDVQKVSPATLTRAQAIRTVALDAVRMIRLVAASFK